jgi:hypothetical protein
VINRQGRGVSRLDKLRRAIAPPIPRVTRSGFFDIIHKPRILRRGLVDGLMGVGDQRLIDAYAEGLDATVELLHSNGWAWPWSGTERGRIEVYVGDLTEALGMGYPFTGYDYDAAGRYTPFIGLQSEMLALTVPAMLDEARHIASHEAFHVYAHAYKPLAPDYPFHWRWFDEGTAVCVEWHLYKNTADRNQFARNWVYRSDQGLEDNYG